MDEIELESMFHSGNPAFKVDQRYDQLMAQMDYYQKELLRRGVTRMQLWEEYIAKNPKGIGLRNFVIIFSNDKLPAIHRWY